VPPSPTSPFDAPGNFPAPVHFAPNAHRRCEIESLKTNKIIGELFLSIPPLGSALCDRCTFAIHVQAFTRWKAYRATLKARTDTSLHGLTNSSFVTDRRGVLTPPPHPPPSPRMIDSPRVGKAEFIPATRFAMNALPCGPAPTRNALTRAAKT